MPLVGIPWLSHYTAVVQGPKTTFAFVLFLIRALVVKIVDLFTNSTSYFIACALDFIYILVSIMATRESGYF